MAISIFIIAVKFLMAKLLDCINYRRITIQLVGVIKDAENKTPAHRAGVFHSFVDADVVIYTIETNYK
jgi:hypothetical protein